MRLIDAEWLKQNFNTVFWSQIAKTIDSAPSIDIVRCRECIHYGRDSERNTYGCNLHSIGMTPSDFCSYGEREGE